MTKAELRRALRELPPLSEESARLKSKTICSQIMNHPAWRTAARVALFHSAAVHEPDLSALWLGRQARSFCFPRVIGESREHEHLEFFHVETGAQLLPSRWGLREPAEDPASLMDPAVIDLILIPGMAFDLSGGRMGRGRGHYDRFLPRLRPDVSKVGICFSEQLVSAVPLEPHDVLLDFVIFA